MSRLADHTLVVSRRCDYERRDAFCERAEAIGLEHWAFFDAIDAQKAKLSTSVETLHGRHMRPAPQPLCTGELGCLLSHLAIWRVFDCLDWKTLCVLEDDVEFVDVEKFWTRWRKFKRALPEDALMAHLAGEEVTRPEDVNKYVARVTHTYGTSAMLLTPKAVDLLTNHQDADTMREPADWLLPGMFDTGRVYCPREPMFRHTNAPGIMPR